MRDFELWIDESGDFEKQTQRDTRMLPSLIGGILVEKGRITEERLSALAVQDGVLGHAMGMDYADMRKRVLPALEETVRLGGRLVYFENAERLDIYSSRELYLRLLAGGLMQLMQYLAREGDFALDVMIAARYVQKDGVLTKIEESEYLDMLTSYLKRGQADGFFEFGHGSRLNLCVLSAREERRLVLADFACNARISRLSGLKFDDDMRERLEALTEPECIYPVSVRSSESYILSRIAIGDIASALLEMYTGRGREDRQKIIREVIRRLRRMSYRHRCSQISQVSAVLCAYARREQDFERAEAVLREVLEVFFPELEESAVYIETDEAELDIALHLAGLFLQEGDIIRAEPVLRRAREITEAMNYRMEHVMQLFEYTMLRSEFQAARMNYREAERIVDSAADTLEEIMSVLACEDNLRRYFNDAMELQSGLLGRALAMKVHIGTFLAAEDPDCLVPEMKEAAERALSQFRYHGEGVRVRLDYALCLARAGRPAEGASMLCRAALRGADTGEAAPLPGESDFRRFLQDITSIDRRTKADRLRIYLDILVLCQRGGREDLARIMAEELVRAKDVFNEFLNRAEYESDLKSDTGKETVIYRDILWKALKEQPAEYHPAEIIYWRYGTYLWISGKGRTAAKENWRKALAVCSASPDYTAMKVISLAVCLEQFALCEDPAKPGRAAKASVRELRKAADSLLKVQGIPEMRKYAQEAGDMADLYLRADETERAALLAAMQKMADRIGF